VLGHSDRELERLGVQARLIEPITRQFFTAAGLTPGMRVLDVGSGAGDVAFLAADLVGEGGEVVGVDRSEAALGAARKQAQSRSLSNVSFERGDAAEMIFDRRFDAVIGRYVLMFQSDPETMLKRLISHVRPGGIVVFHEPEWSCARSFPTVASWDRCCQLVVETMESGGADMQMGMKLSALFVAVGLPAPSMQLVSVIGGGDHSSDQIHFTVDVAVTLLPQMEELGLVAPGEIDAHTWDEKIIEEVAASGSVVVGRSDIGAWSTLPE
jgi:SAM-dependent methyltransferase